MQKMQITPEDIRFDDILKMDGISIQSFQQQESLDLFPNAQYHPEFFNQNLVNPNRILKQFLNDPQSNIRIFYFQVLRLAFEIPSEHGYNHPCLHNFKKIIFHPQFQIMFTPDTENERQIYNDFQFKKLFAQFITLLISASESQVPSIQQTINQFPIIDIVMTHIIRSLLVSLNIKVPFDQNIPTDQLFKQLSSILQLSLTSYGNCWKFEQSDMFCYEQSINEVYMAYILQDPDEDLEQDVQQSQNDQQQRFNYQPIPIIVNSVYQNISQINSYQHNTNQIINPQLVKMTNTYKDNNIKNIQSQIVTQKTHINLDKQVFKTISNHTQTKYQHIKSSSHQPPSPYQPPSYKTQQNSSQVQQIHHQPPPSTKQTPYQSPSYSQQLSKKPLTYYKPPSYQTSQFYQPKRNVQHYPIFYQAKEAQKSPIQSYKAPPSSFQHSPLYQPAIQRRVPPVSIKTTTPNYENLSIEDRNIQQMFLRIENTLNNIHGGELNPPNRFKNDVVPLQPIQKYKAYSYQSTYREHSQLPRHQTQRYCTEGSSTNFKPFQKQQIKKYEVPSQLLAYNTANSVFSSKPSTAFNCLKKDRSQDFTPADILNKLRSDNRDNISKIKEQYKSIRTVFNYQDNTKRAASNIEIINKNGSTYNFNYQIRPSSTNLYAGNNYNQEYGLLQI